MILKKKYSKITILKLDPIELFYQELNCFKDYQNEYRDTYFSFVWWLLYLDCSKPLLCLACPTGKLSFEKKNLKCVWTKLHTFFVIFCKKPVKIPKNEKKIRPTPPLQPSPEMLGTIWICQGMGIYIPQLILKQVC